MGTYRQVVEAPRWARLPSFLKDVAHGLDLRLSLEIDKGWVFERVRFRFEGDDAAIRKAAKVVDQSLKQYNAGLMR